MINLSDYSVHGAGEMTTDDLVELQKALQAGSLSGGQSLDLTTASGAPLKVESLENTLKIITFQEGDIVLWQKVPKLPAFNTVEEYNQLESYGADRGGFTNEGELPESEDSTYVRRAQLVKFMGVTKSVTHPMQLVNINIGDIIQREVKNGTLFILRKVNRGLTISDSTKIPQEFNGLYQQQQSQFNTLDDWQDFQGTIDLRGAPLIERFIEDGALSIIENFGYGNLLMAPPKVLSDFVKSFHESKRIIPNSPGVTDGVMGQRVNQFMSQYGLIDLGYDKFMNTGTVSRKTVDPAQSTKAPAVVTANSLVAVTDTLNRFLAAFAGDYYVAVSAVNRFGESQLVDISGSGSLVTVSALQSIDIEFTDGGGAFPATAYTIYRSEKDPATAIGITPLYPVFTVSTAELSAGFDGAAADKVRDRNRFIPNTNSAFLIQNDTEVWSVKQLAPLMKMDLARLAPETRFAILLYLTLQLYAPRKMVRFINIGQFV